MSDKKSMDRNNNILESQTKAADEQTYSPAAIIISLIILLHINFLNISILIFENINTIFKCFFCL